MLANLYISNIVLIDRLNLEFGPGLNVLTGETGAGKSILLDALALSLGARGDAGLIRHGCETAQVIAEFQLSDVSRRLSAVLSDAGVESDGTLVLRRQLSTDGKSRAWVNDVPVSVRALKQIGDQLCEIHGQFENHSLMDPATHIAALDEFAAARNFSLCDGAAYAELLKEAKNSYHEFHAAEKRLRELRELLDRGAAEREFLEHDVKELSALNPLPGEEEELAAKRAALMDAEKNAAILAEAEQSVRGLDEKMFAAARILQRVKTEPNPYSAQIDRLFEMGEAAGEISAAIAPGATDTASLEDTEARLFAIRAAARKHRVSAADLPEKLRAMTAQLGSIDNSDAELRKITSEAGAGRKACEAAAARLTQARIAASAKLRDAILAELPDLKLGQTDFMARTDRCAPAALGMDAVTFMIRTNPGMPFAPLHKIASGGELARLMLALRVILMGGAGAKAFVFDEVDAGISGATAAAVGSRLARLAAGGQALVITHSAQVAGFADKHFLITKTSAGDTTTTSVAEIENDTRLNEIARIISGDKITPEAVATARTLLK
jgi:DNA repair protein RecN (Recombination protein N)